MGTAVCFSVQPVGISKVLRNECMVLCGLRQDLCRLLTFGSGKAAGGANSGAASKGAGAAANAIWCKAARLPQDAIPASGTSCIHGEHRSTAALQCRLFPQSVSQLFRYQLCTGLHRCKDEPCKISAFKHFPAYRGNCSTVRISGRQVFHAAVSEKHRMHTKPIPKEIYLMSYSVYKYLTIQA